MTLKLFICIFLTLVTTHTKIFSQNIQNKADSIVVLEKITENPMLKDKYSKPKYFDNLIEDGQVVLSFGIGTRSFAANKAIKNVALNNLNIKVKSVGPIIMRIEKSFDYVLAGVSFSYLNVQAPYQTYSSEYNKFITSYYFYKNITINFDYKFYLYQKHNINLYAGFGYGYNFYHTHDKESKEKLHTDDQLGSFYDLHFLNFQAVAGLMYFPTGHLGIFIEGGYYKSFGQFGLCYKY